MTDVSQGPGWWIASDGKWYPPHLHPSVAQTAASPLATVAAGQPVWGPPSDAGIGFPGSSPLPAYPPGYGPPPGMPAMGTLFQDPAVRLDGVLRLALAPWWKRFLAFLIDSMILSVVIVIIVAVIAAATHNSHASTANNQPLSAGQAAIGFLALFILLAIPYMLYFGIMNGSKRGQTLGKMAMSIAVRDSRTAGPIGFWRGVGRYAITVVFCLVLVVPYVIDNLSPLWDGRRQAWHDHVVHSVVVEREG
jgi:uncharacterized RDD family membrane protein YckC